MAVAGKVRSINTATISRFSPAVGLPPIRYMGRPPLQDKVVHMIVKPSQGVVRTDMEKAFKDGPYARLARYKTFVSFGIESFRSFINMENHAESVIALHNEAADTKESFDRLELRIKELTGSGQRALDEIKDQGEIADKFDEVQVELKRADELEERLLLTPDFIINSVPILGSMDNIRLIARNYFCKPMTSIISIYDTGEHKLEFGEALSNVLYFAENQVLHSFILLSSGKSVGFIFNKTLISSLGLISFLKSVYPETDMLLVAQPSEKGLSPAETETMRENEKQAVKDLLRLGFTAGDIVTINGSREALVEAAANKLKRIVV